MRTVQDYLEYDVYDWRKHHHDNVECRKRAEAETSVCKWCRSHATQVTSRGHVVRYACGVSHDRQFDRWFILDTACDRFRMRNRIKQLEREVKAAKHKAREYREQHRIYRLLVRYQTDQGLRTATAEYPEPHSSHDIH